MGKDIVQFTEPGGLIAHFEANGINIADVGRALIDAAGPQGISVFDLERIRMPGAGGLSFGVMVDGEPAETPEIVGAIVGDKEGRAYYETPFGSGKAGPPDCVSMDLITGIGKPGGDCRTCPYAQWNSKIVDGKTTDGQACAHRRAIMLLTPESALPRFISAPPSSLRPIRKAFIQQGAGRGVSFYDALWAFVLRLEQNDKNVSYSVISPKFVRPLTEDEKALALTFRESFDPESIYQVLVEPQTTK